MLGAIIQVIVLLINAMAVLSEDRFLARIGWGSSSSQQQQQFQQQQQSVAAGFQQSYDQTGYGAPQDIGVKAKIVDLISAVRTLMRIPLIVVNIVVIFYELILG